MADLDQLKQKYAPVLDLFPKFQPWGPALQTVDLDGDKLHIKGTVTGTVVANQARIDVVPQSMAISAVPEPIAIVFAFHVGAHPPGPVAAAASVNA